MDSLKDLHAMINKHKQIKKKSIRNNRKSKDNNALIEKKIQKFLKKKERQKKSSSTFKENRFLIMKVKRVSPAWQKVWKVVNFYPVVLNEILAQTNYLLHV